MLVINDNINYHEMLASRFQWTKSGRQQTWMSILINITMPCMSDQVASLLLLPLSKAQTSAIPMDNEVWQQ